MTLPPNCLPTELPASPAGLLPNASAGAVPTQTSSDPTGGFASLLPAAVGTANDAATAPAAPGTSTATGVSPGAPTGDFPWMSLPAGTAAGVAEVSLPVTGATANPQASATAGTNPALRYSVFRNPTPVTTELAAAPTASALATPLPARTDTSEVPGAAAAETAAAAPGADTDAAATTGQGTPSAPIPTPVYPGYRYLSPAAATPRATGKTLPADDSASTPAAGTDKETADTGKDSAGTADPAVLVYQLVAGQWLPQAPQMPAPTSPANPSGPAPSGDAAGTVTSTTTVVPASMTGVAASSAAPTSGQKGGAAPRRTPVSQPSTNSAATPTATSAATPTGITSTSLTSGITLPTTGVLNSIPTPAAAASVAEVATSTAQDAASSSSVSEAGPAIPSALPAAAQPADPAPASQGQAEAASIWPEVLTSDPSPVVVKPGRRSAASAVASDARGDHFRSGDSAAPAPVAPAFSTLPGLSPTTATTMTPAAEANAPAPTEAGQPATLPAAANPLSSQTPAASAPTTAGAAPTPTPAGITPANTNPPAATTVAQHTEASAPAVTSPGTTADDPAASAAARTAPATASATLDSGAALLQNPAAQNAPEKFAASRSVRRADSTSGGISSIGDGEKKTVSVDGKKVITGANNIGTNTANRDISMSYSAPNKPLATDASGSVHASSGGNQQADAAKASTPVDVASAAQAGRLVHEIRDIADRVTSVDQNSVEVRFDFSDSDRLSVRVEYRDGAVHTTFRTDSPQVRDAVSHEWAAQASTDINRNYRLAEPVFTASDGSRSSASNSEGGSGQSRQQQQANGSGQGFPGSSGRFAGTRNPGSSGSAVPVRSTIRPETSLHLHTFA